MSKQTQAPGQLELVREFVNTLDVLDREEHLAEPHTLAAWLAEHGLAAAGVHATRADLSRAISLRESLRAVLLAHTEREPVPAAAVETLDSIARRAGVRLRFGSGAEASLEPEAGGVDGALGRLLAVVHDAMADGTWRRLKACREHSCEWAFYDHTKNRSGAWCNMGVCGNRVKARAYRDRQSERRSATPEARS